MAIYQKKASSTSTSTGAKPVKSQQVLPDQRPQHTVPKILQQSSRAAPAILTPAASTGRPLPSDLNQAIQRHSGYALNDVRVHYNSTQATQLNAKAYAQTQDIHLGPGQQHHLAHEAWHLVQQAQGRVKPTAQLHNGVAINEQAGLEREADQMAQTLSQTTNTRAASSPKQFASKQQSPVLQGKWFRMSTILDEEDEFEVSEIQKLAEQGDFQSAFEAVIFRHPSLIKDYQTILHVAQKYGQMGYVRKVLEESFQQSSKAYTSAEIIEGLEAYFGKLIQQDRDYNDYDQYTAELLSPQERGLIATDEVQDWLSSGKVKDSLELKTKFPYLVLKYGMTKIALDQSQTPVRLKFKINPEFEILLNGSNAIEMRSEGGGNSAHQTKVQWFPQTLALSTTKNSSGGSYTVGKYMRAFPLSQDHAAGSAAKADSDHSGMMSKLPAAGNRKLTGSGSGPYYFIKGHLLNDNLGGIANQSNLFPITHEANGQHKTYVEEYIKKGVEKGYVYRYEVNIANIKVKDESFKSWTGFAVDSDIEFKFARLDSAHQDVANSAHQGKIESRYESKGNEPFDKATEYKNDYDGSYNKPKKLGSEAIHKTSEKSPKSSNSGLSKNVKKFSFAEAEGSQTLGLSTNSGKSQSINPSAALPPTGSQLSMQQSPSQDIVSYFEAIVKNWSNSDIANWQKDVVSSKYRRWDQIFDAAVKKFNLEQTMADAIRKSWLVRVTINGQAK